MKIDTEDWMPLSEAMPLLEMSDRAARRLAADLGVVRIFFGVQCIKKKHIELLNSKKRRVGNQRWIASGEAAGEAAIKAVESRTARIEKQGFTEAERRRNTFLSSGKTRGGGKLNDAT